MTNNEILKISNEVNKKTQFNKKIDQDDINSAVWAACDSFRGTVEPSDYKNYILAMLFLKYLSDVWQDHYEEYQKQFGDNPEIINELMENEKFKLPVQANFYTLYKDRDINFVEVDGEKCNLGTRIDKAFHAIEDANAGKLTDVFQDISFNSNKLGEESQKKDILKSLLEDYAKPDLNLRPSRVGGLDVIGDAYEFLIKNFAANSGKSAGEFYTPPEVSTLISQLVKPQENDEICDPTCGSGSLLMKCGKRVQENSNGAMKYSLYGQEAIGSTWAIAKMNMFLHGEYNHSIEWGDTIRNPKLLNEKGNLRTFDVVVANPPFSLDKWGHDKADSDKFGRFKRGLPPKTKGDYAFICHMIETLKEKTGRMGVVVPHGVLFRGAAEGKIRTKLIEENLLDAVIGLPEKLFYGTGIPAAILIFKKGREDKDVLFIDASKEFVKGKNQNALSLDNMQKILDTYLDREVKDKYSYIANLDEIKENDFNLNIPRYVDTFEEEEPVDLKKVLAERVTLKQELTNLEKQMDNYLKELGLND